RQQVTAWLEAVHEETTRFFAALDGGGEFREDAWERPGGGGGVARVLEGVTFEKAGVNRSAVEGILPAAGAQRVGALPPPLQDLVRSLFREHPPGRGAEGHRRDLFRQFTRW